MNSKPMKRRLVLIAVSLSALGIIAYAATIVVVAVGTNSHSELLGGPAAVTVRTASFAPGEVGVWHYHPGPVFNVVTHGTVTIEDGCGGEETFATGQAFEEGGRVHRPRIPAAEGAFVYQTFVVPQGSPPAVNIPNNERRCGPPRNVNECQSGWINFTHPRTFSNQGDCIQWINTGQ